MVVIQSKNEPKKEVSGEWRIWVLCMEELNNLYGSFSITKVVKLKRLWEAIYITEEKKNACRILIENLVEGATWKTEKGMQG